MTKDRVSKQRQTAAKLRHAIRDGLEHARQSGLTKDYDVATCIELALEARGLRVVRAPKSEV